MEETDLDLALDAHGLLTDAADRERWVGQLLATASKDRRSKIHTLLLQHKKTDGRGDVDQTILQTLYDLSTAVAASIKPEAPKLAVKKTMSPQLAKKLAAELGEECAGWSFHNVAERVASVAQSSLGRLVTYADVWAVIKYFPANHADHLRKFNNSPEKSAAVTPWREILLILDTYLLSVGKDGASDEVMD